MTLQYQNFFILQDGKNVPRYLCKIPHIHRAGLKRNMDNPDVLNQWTRLKNQDLKTPFTDKLKELLNGEEQFLTFHPPSTCHIFVDDMQEWIQKVFPNSVDISHYFKKPPGFSIGAEENQGKSVDELLAYFSLTKEINEISEKHRKAKTLFFYDDVYSTGKTTEVMIALLKRYGVVYDRLIKGYICRMQSTADRFT